VLSDDQCHNKFSLCRHIQHAVNAGFLKTKWGGAG